MPTLESLQETLGVFTSSPPTARSRLYMVSWDDLMTLYNEEDISYDLVVYLERSLLGTFESGRYCSFTARALSAFLRWCPNAFVVNQYQSNTSENIFFVSLKRVTIIPPSVEETLLSRSQNIRYPFETMVWNSHASPRHFEYLVTRILSPVLKRAVVLNVPHGERAPYTDRGPFAIHVWSSPTRTARDVSPPREIWGIYNRMSDSAFACSDRRRKPKSLGRIIDDATGFVVAEVFPNALYVHLDVVHYGSRSEFEIFSRMLHETAKILAKPEWERLMDVVKAQHRRTQQELFRRLIQKSIPARVDRIEEAREEAKERVANLRAELFDAERTLFGLEQQHRGDRSQVIEQFKTEYARLQDGSHGSVKNVRLYENPSGRLSFEFQTKMIHALHPKTRKTHELGKFRILINLEQGGDRMVNFTNLTHQVIGYEGGLQPAPHVFESGYPCWGNIDDDISSYVANFELQAAVSLIITFLERGTDSDDPLGKVISKFPEVVSDTQEQEEAVGVDA